MTKKRIPEARLRPISLAPLTEDEALGLLLKTPPPPKERDEIAERLKAETTARVKQSRQLIAESKRSLKRKRR